LSTVVDDVVLTERLLREARQSRDRLLDLQHEAELAQVAYQHAIRRLHAAGGSMREIADTLALSYQRVHQIVDVSTGKGAVKQSRIAGLTCAFCGATGSEARRLIAGPGVYICDRCVDLAHEVCAEGSRRANDLTMLVPLDLADPKARCSFCGKRRDQTEAMVHAPLSPRVGKHAKLKRDSGVRVCRDCLRLCDEILAEEAAMDRGG
jgi:ClpX C4-type zinc finger